MTAAIFDADELRAKALAATPGPWELRGCSPEHTIDRNRYCYQVRSLRGFDGSTVVRSDADKAHMAAANPAVVLALLDERATLLARVEAAEAERDRLKRELRDELREAQRGGMSWAEATGSEGDDS